VAQRKSKIKNEKLKEVEGISKTLLHSMLSNKKPVEAGFL